MSKTKELEEAKKKLEVLTYFIMYIANDYIELSHDKIVVQRNDYMRRAKKIRESLHSEKFTLTIEDIL